MKKAKETMTARGRREFLKKAAVGTAALSIPIILHSSAIPSAAGAEEGGKMVFRFLDLGDGMGVLSGKTLFMEGDPKFGSSGPVTGGGGYVIADTATFSVVSDFGTWRAKKFVSFTNVGKVAAGFLGGTLTMDVILQSEDGGGDAEATVTVNCDGGAVLTPSTGGGGSGAGDIVMAVIKSGTFAGTFGPGSVIPFNVNVIVAP